MSVAMLPTPCVLFLRLPAVACVSWLAAAARGLLHPWFGRSPDTTGRPPRTAPGLQRRSPDRPLSQIGRKLRGQPLEPQPRVAPVASVAAPRRLHASMNPWPARYQPGSPYVREHRGAAAHHGIHGPDVRTRASLFRPP